MEALAPLAPTYVDEKFIILTVRQLLRMAVSADLSAFIRALPWYFGKVSWLSHSADSDRH